VSEEVPTQECMKKNRDKAEADIDDNEGIINTRQEDESEMY